MRQPTPEPRYKSIKCNVKLFNGSNKLIFSDIQPLEIIPKWDETLVNEAYDDGGGGVASGGGAYYDDGDCDLRPDTGV